MNYEEQLECKRPECTGTLTIPIKIVVKENLAAIISRCPKCRKKYKVNFHMQERQQWLALIRKLFLKCEVCGEPLSPNWHIIGSGHSAFTSQFGFDTIFRLGNPCYNCRKNDAKACSEFLWSDINPLPPPPPPKTQLSSPPINNLFCTQCGTSIKPGTRFCAACGSKV